MFGLRPVAMVLTLVASASPVFASEVDRERPRHIVTEVSVDISDGTHFDATMEYRSPLMARYRQDFGDLTLDFETDGERVSIVQNGTAVRNIPDGMATWILGHQFHAQMLLFAELNEGIADEGPYAGSGEADCPCREIRGNRSGLGRGIERYALVVNSETEQPQFLLVYRTDADPVVARFEDWRVEADRELPYRIVVDDGEAVFDFRFESIEIG